MQVAAPSPFSHRFVFITGLWPICWSDLPISGLPGLPGEFRRLLERHEDRARVILEIGADAQFGTWFHDLGQQVQKRARHQSAFDMLPFWPGIGEENKGAVHAASW